MDHSASCTVVPITCSGLFLTASLLVGACFLALILVLFHEVQIALGRNTSVNLVTPILLRCICSDIMVYRTVMYVSCKKKYESLTESFRVYSELEVGEIFFAAVQAVYGEIDNLQSRHRYTAAVVCFLHTQRHKNESSFAHKMQKK